MDPVVKPLTCPSCKKQTNVRVIPTATSHTFHCPGCKAIVRASS